MQFSQKIITELSIRLFFGKFNFSAKTGTFMSFRNSGFFSIVLPAVTISYLVVAFPAKAGDIAGTWWIEDRSEVAKLDHRHLPLTPDGVVAYRKNQENLKAQKGGELAENKCLPPGIPNLMLARYPFQILQRPEQVTFLHEKMHLARLIYIDEERPAGIDLAYDGYATGHWVDDTLVVDTTGFKPNSMIDKTGIPHSDQLHVTERFSTQDHGKKLLDHVTLEDPKIFSHAVSFDITFAKHPEVRLMEDACTFGPPQRDTLKKQVR